MVGWFCLLVTGFLFYFVVSVFVGFFFPQKIIMERNCINALQCKKLFLSKKLLCFLKIMSARVERVSFS